MKIISPARFNARGRRSSIDCKPPKINQADPVQNAASSSNSDAVDFSIIGVDMTHHCNIVILQYHIPFIF